MDITGIAKSRHADIPKASSKKEWKLSDSLREKITGCGTGRLYGDVFGEAAITIRGSEVRTGCAFCGNLNQSSLGNSLKMQQKNRPYKRIQQVGEKNVHFKIVQGNFPEKRA